jgi:hypothetical protein
MTWNLDDHDLNGELRTGGTGDGNEIDDGDDNYQEKDSEEEWYQLTSKGSFEIDLLNIRGSIKIRLMGENFSSSREIAFIEIPVFGIIDSTCTLPDHQWFTKTFPLIIRDSSSKGYSGYISPHDQLFNRLVDKNQPRIQLSMRLAEKVDVHSKEGRMSYARLQIPSFSFSCIDSDHARDVMLVTLLACEVKVASARDSTNCTAMLTNFQVDNQLLDAMSSVILSPTPVKSPQPVLRFHMKKKNLLSQSNLKCYETLQLVIQELDLKLEQQTVLASWEMIKSWTKELASIGQVSDSRGGSGGDTVRVSDTSRYFPDTGNDSFSAKDALFMRPDDSDTVRNLQQSGFIESIEPSRNYDIKKLIDDEDVEKLYIDDFKIFPIQINVSFIINPTYIIRKYRKEQREDNNHADSNNVGFYSAFSVLLWQIGAVVLDLTSSISDAPVFFNGFEAPHLFKTTNDVTRILQEHYLHSALGQIYKIVFSSDVVGNPIALLSSLSVGVHDFFYEPAHALITTPTEISKIGKGFVKGAASLVSNVGVGFIGIPITFTRSIGRGVLKLSMDESFIKAREKLQQNPKTVSETIARPFKDIGNGLYHGITGLVTVPYRSIKKKGFIRGAIPGLTKGVIGLGADPVVGILDAVAHCGDTAKEFAKKINKHPDKLIERVRLGEIFGPDGRILPYDYNVAFGTQILNAIARPYEESLLASTLMQGNNIVHEVLGGNDVIIPLEKGSRASFTASMAFHPRNTQKAPNTETMARLSLAPKSSSVETYRNPLTGSGSVDVNNDDDDDSLSDDSDLKSSRHRSHHHGKKTATSPHSSPSSDDSTAAEYVIHTAIIHKRNDSLEYDIVAVVSSKRLLIFEHHRRGNGTYLKKKWETLLKQLATPTIETAEGDAALVLHLQLLSDGRNLHRRKSLFGNDAFKRPSNVGKGGIEGGKNKNNFFKLRGNYLGDHIIINLFNCLNTLLGNFDTLERTDLGTLSVCIEDELGIRHIGPWQFSGDLSKTRTIRRNGQFKLMYRDLEETTRVLEENRKTINNLKYSPWMCNSNDNNSGKNAKNVNNTSYSSERPQWLIDEEATAVADQNNLHNLHQECKELEKEFSATVPAARQKFQVLLAKLHAREINVDEFRYEVGKARRYHQDSIHYGDRGGEDDRSLNSSTVHEGKPKKDRFQTAMRRLSFLSSLSKRTSQSQPAQRAKSDSIDSPETIPPDVNDDDNVSRKDDDNLSVSSKSRRKNGEIISSLSKLLKSGGKKGKELLEEEESDDGEIITTFLPFTSAYRDECVIRSNPVRPKSRQHHHSPTSLSSPLLRGQQPTTGGSASSFTSLFPAEKQRTATSDSINVFQSLKGSGSEDDSNLTPSKKPSWLSMLFNDANSNLNYTETGTSNPPEVWTESPSSLPPSLSEKNHGKSSPAPSSNAGSDNAVLMLAEEETGETQAEDRSTKDDPQQNKSSHDLFDVFPHYEHFEGEFDENGDHVENKFSTDSVDSRLTRLNSKEVNKAFNSDIFSAYSFEDASPRSLISSPSSFSFSPSRPRSFPSKHFFTQSFTRK